MHSAPKAIRLDTALVHLASVFNAVITHVAITIVSKIAPMTTGTLVRQHPNFFNMAGS